MADFVTETSMVDNTSAPIAGTSGDTVMESSTRSADGTTVSSRAGTLEKIIPVGRRRMGVSVSDSAKKLLLTDDSGAEETTAAPPAAAAAADVDGKESTATPDPAAADAKDAPKPVDPVAEYRAMNERLTTRNAALLQEVEQLRSSRPKKDADERLRAFEEIDSAYFDSPALAIRKLVANIVGEKDPNSDRVTREMKGLYQDLTEKELEVSPSESARAERESLRTRLMVERERRDREAAAAKQNEPAQPSDLNEGHVARVASFLPAIGTKFPLATGLAEHFDGEKPERLILRMISKGFATGEFDPATDDDKLVEAAAAKIENHYRGLVEKIDGARSKPISATPTPASDPKDSPSSGAGRSPVARTTITNAHASVAPAAPPAKKPEAAATPPQYVSEKARIRALAEKYAGKPGRA